MAQAYTLSQEQSELLEKVISSIVENDGESFSSEDLGIIKHIISSEDFEIYRRNFAMMRQLNKVEGGLLSLEFRYEALMGAIGNIFRHAVFRGKSVIFFRESNEKIDDNIQRTVYELYWEMISKCACGVDDAHQVSLALLHSVRNYSWVDQAVLIVAAFAMSIGEFWLTVEPLAKDPLSNSICLFKRPDCLIQVNDSVKFGLESVRILVERIWDSTKFLVEYQKGNTSMSGVSYPVARLAGYEVVYGVVTCISHNIALVRMNKEYTTLATEVQQITSSSERLAYLQSYVNARRTCLRRAKCKGRGRSEAGHRGPSREDIAKFMSRSISQTGKLVLGHRSTKGKVTLDELKGRSIAFLISDFKVQKEEFSSLVKTYEALNNNPEIHFEIVWVPMMVDQSTTWTEDNKTRVRSIGASMPWYWVWDPSSNLKDSFLKLVKEEWHFQGEPILVILDRGGLIMHTNALPMIELWGPSGYPFTRVKEEQIQQGPSHAIDFMFSDYEPNMEKWAEEGKIICFYGSHNEDWVRRFLQKMESITAHITSFEMEIIYVGANKKQEELPRILTAIKDINNNCRAWSEERIQSFWRHLKKLTCPKPKERGGFPSWREVTNTDFAARKELFSIVNYDEDKEDGWAVIFGDPEQQEEFVRSNGKKLMECLDRFTIWGSGIQGPKDFLRELNKDVRETHAPQHCKPIMVPAKINDGPSWMHCLECGRFMG